MRYDASITAGALKIAESRVVAELLLRKLDADGWKEAIVTKNVLLARNPATAKRLTTLIRGRLETMGPDLWKLVRDGKGTVATHAVFAAAVKAKATSTSHRKKLQKEQDDLKKQEAELRTFEEKLKHAADQRISLDLDDGVKVNYAKFGDLLAESKAITGGREDD